MITRVGDMIRLSMSVRRPTCSDCRLPQVVCVCAHVTVVSARPRVVILQHPKEENRTVNTARLVPLVLPESQLLVGTSFSRELIEPLIEGPAYVVFPGPEAQPAAEVDPDCTLFFLDGTWSMAKKIFHNSPALIDLPCIAFEPSQPSRYRIRKQPAPNYVCTIEAVAEVLALLDQREAAVALLRPFDHLVERQLSFRGVDPRHADRGPR